MACSTCYNSWHAGHDELGSYPGASGLQTSPSPSAVQPELCELFAWPRRQPRALTLTPPSPPPSHSPPLAADLVLRVTYKADAASTSGTAGGEGGAGAGAAAAPVYKPVTVVVGAQDSVEDVRQNALTLVNRRLVLEGEWTITSAASRLVATGKRGLGGRQGQIV